LEKLSRFEIQASRVFVDFINRIFIDLPLDIIDLPIGYLLIYHWILLIYQLDIY